MFEITGENRKKYAHLFSECEDSCIITAVEGCGGEMWVDSLEKTECALIIVGEYAFLAGNGKSETAPRLAAFADERFKDSFNIRCVAADFVPLVEDEYKNRIRKYSRYATKRSFEHMDFDALEEKVKSLPEDFFLAPLEGSLYDFCVNSEWAKDFVTSFKNDKDWEEKGLGIMIMRGNEPVAGASSYSVYPGGIEVEIITREDYRGRGFAQITGAALLLECRKRGILASWDAAHEGSLRLAMKLGFEFLYEYDCYSISKKTS